jgi:hypothetical protein
MSIPGKDPYLNSRIAVAVRLVRKRPASPWAKIPDKNYLVRFKESNLAPQLVRATTVEIMGSTSSFSDLAVN